MSGTSLLRDASVPAGRIPLGRERDDCDALFGDDESEAVDSMEGAGSASADSSMHDINARPSSALSHISQAGYRAGVQAMQDLRLQEGFDAGFEVGIAIGEELGAVYARCRVAFARALAASHSRLLQDDAPGVLSSVNVEQLSEYLVRLEEILFKTMTIQRAEELKREVLELAKNFDVC
jgi:hypothetical protein